MKQFLQKKILNVIYHLEKSIVNPIYQSQFTAYRKDGCNYELAKMDTDGGQITNNQEVKIINGTLCENEVQESLVHLRHFLNNVKKNLNSDLNNSKLNHL
ncbi:MAG: hypothetical protein ACK41T_02605 [Pseudobdellovibrio sp.]